MSDRVAFVGERLRALGWKVAVAESCTGGLLGHLLTRRSGASDYFVGGLITYSNAMKRVLLGVSMDSLERWGAVSSQVAYEMARGAQQRTGAQVALSITGIAGPTGGTAQKPVGLTYVGLFAPHNTWVWRHLWQGERVENQAASAEAALAHLARFLMVRE